MLIVFRPFKAGGSVEAGGVSGTLEGVQVFAQGVSIPFPQTDVHLHQVLRPRAQSFARPG